MRFPTQPGNGHRRHKRRDRKHHDADYFTRGPRRTGPIGTITPGDHEEVARDIQRLWEYLHHLRRQQQACCNDQPTGQAADYSGTVLGINGLAAYWRLGEPTPADLSVPNVGYFKDSSGHTIPLDLQIARAGTHVSDPEFAFPNEKLRDSDDGSVRLTFARLGTYPVSSEDGGVGISTGTVSDPERKKDIDFTQRLRSIAVWIRPERNTTAEGAGVYASGFKTAILSAPFIDTGYNNRSWALEFQPVERELHFVTNQASLTEVDRLTAPTAPNWDEWLHVAVTLDDSDNTWRLYLGGVLVASTPKTGSPAGSLATVAVGSDTYPSGVNAYIGSFLGAIDEAALFTETLTPSEIASLAAGGPVSTSDGSTTFSADDLADGSVTPAKVQPGAADAVLTSTGTASVWDKVKTAMIEAGAIITSKIADAAVTTVKLADDAVTLDKISTTGAAADGDVLTYDAPTNSVLWQAGGGGGSTSKRLIASWEGTQPDSLRDGTVWVVPYVNGASVTFNLDRAVFRLETVGLTDGTVRIQKSPGGGAFTPTDIVSLTVPAGSHEIDDVASLGTVASGTLLRITWDALASGASTFLVQLEGSS